MSNRIFLEKFKTQDFALFYGLVKNESVMAMITDQVLTMDEAKLDFEERIENNNLHPAYGLFKVFDAATNNFIGAGKISLKNKDLKEAELGYMLYPAYWGNGYGNEITEVLIDKARKEPTLKKLTAIINPANIASRKILINNGFTAQKLSHGEQNASELYELEMVALHT